MPQQHFQHIRCDLVQNACQIFLLALNIRVGSFQIIEFIFAVVFVFSAHKGHQPVNGLIHDLTDRSRKQNTQQAQDQQQRHIGAKNNARAHFGVACLHGGQILQPALGRLVIVIAPCAGGTLLLQIFLAQIGAGFRNAGQAAVVHAVAKQRRTKAVVGIHRHLFSGVFHQGCQTAAVDLKQKCADVIADVQLLDQAYVTRAGVQQRFGVLLGIFQKGVYPGAVGFFVQQKPFAGVVGAAHGIRIAAIHLPRQRRVKHHALHQIVLIAGRLQQLDDAVVPAAGFVKLIHRGHHIADHFIIPHQLAHALGSILQRLIHQQRNGFHAVQAAGVQLHALVLAQHAADPKHQPHSQQSKKCRHGNKNAPIHTAAHQLHHSGFEIFLFLTFHASVFLFPLFREAFAFPAAALFRPIISALGGAAPAK